MDNFRVLGKIGEGTFSDVLKIQSLIDGKYYACKRMKQKYSSMDQVNNLREVQALRRLSPHPHILELKQVVFDPHTGVLSLICELMDMNAYELIKDRKTFLSEQRIKLFVYQLCKALYHLHRNGIFHRDVKPENILIKGDIVKLADFGSCRSIYSHQPYTEYISTRWYRAPECLLTDGYYSYKMDMWSVGSVMFELMTLHPLFPGTNELDQIARIHTILGTPSDDVLDKFRRYQSKSMSFNFPRKVGTGISGYLKHAMRGCTDLILRLCTYDPDERFSAKQALRHPYFAELREAEIRALKAKHEQSVSGTSSLRGSAMAASAAGRQHHFGRRQFHRPHLSTILPEVQDGSHGDRQQPADPIEGERQQVEGNEASVSAKQVALPELVAKSPPAWPGHAEKKHPEPFYKNVSSGKTLPGVLHHQKKRQVPQAKLHKPHHKAPKPHFLLPLNHKNGPPRL